MVMRDFYVAPYMGKWIEVSSIPQEWEKNYADDSKKCYGAIAEYKLIRSHPPTIEVINSCLDKNGEITGKIYGQATPAKYTSSNCPTGRISGDLVVEFPSVSKSKGNYLVLDTDYVNYAMVGGSDSNSLWIMRRPNTSLSVYTYNRLVRMARRNGYNVDKLEIV